MSKQHAREITSCEKRISRLNRQEEKLSNSLTKLITKINKEADKRKRKIDAETKRSIALTKRVTTSRIKALANEGAALTKRILILSGRLRSN